MRIRDWSSDVCSSDLHGAATFLLLGQIRRKLFPDREGMMMPKAVKALSEPADFARVLVTAGYRDPRIEPVTHDYMLDLAALAEPDSLFGMSPDWTSLDAAEKDAVITEVRQMAGERSEEHTSELQSLMR